jgi:hypothetical protein
VSQPAPACQTATPEQWGGSWQYYFYFGGPGGRNC